MSGMQIFGNFVLFGTIAIFLVCFAIYAVLSSRRHFHCPKCGMRFKAPASRSFFAARDGTDKRMTCPNCGYFGYMEDCRDSEVEEEIGRAESETVQDMEIHGTEEEKEQKENTQKTDGSYKATVADDSSFSQMNAPDEVTTPKNVDNTPGSP